MPSCQYKGSPCRERLAFGLPSTSQKSHINQAQTLAAVAGTHSLTVSLVAQIFWASDSNRLRRSWYSSSCYKEKLQVCLETGKLQAAKKNHLNEVATRNSQVRSTGLKSHELLATDQHNLRLVAESRLQLTHPEFQLWRLSQLPWKSLGSVQE